MPCFSIHKIYETKNNMTFVKVLLIVGLIFGVVKNSTAMNYRLSNSVMPKSYNISIELRTLGNYLVCRGHLAVELVTTRKTNVLLLHSHNMRIDGDITISYRIRHSMAYVQEVVQRAVNYDYNDDLQMLVITFDCPLSPRGYTLKMEYHTFLQEEKVFIRNNYTDAKGDTWLVFMPELKPTMARGLFPCWDDPAFKATFTISIRHPVKYTALSNARIREVLYGTDGTVWTHFDTTPVMSTYQLAIVLTNLLRIPNNDQTTDVWGRPDIADQFSFLRHISNTITTFMIWYTKYVPPIQKMDHIAIPQFTNETKGGRWGINIYREEDIVYDKKLNPISHKLDISIDVARQTAEQWFGNLVGPTWWNHLWLSKTLATFYGYLALSKIDSTWHRRSYFLFRIQKQALSSDYADHPIPVTEKVNNPDDSDKLYSSIYSSACCVRETALMIMLQRMLSEEVFRVGVIEYFNRHQFGSATPDDFWSALQDALNKSNNRIKDYNIKEFMEAWLTRRSYPVVKVTRDYNTNITVISQHKSHGVGDTPDRRWIPINYAIQSDRSFTNNSFSIWLRPEDENVTIANITRNNWIIVNVQHSGYYRVNYDLTNWRKIVKYLNSNSYKKIDCLDRAHILNDAYYFLMKNQFDPPLFLELVNYLNREIKYAPWYSFKEILSDMSTLFKYPGSAFIKRHMLQILHQLLEKVGIKEIPSEDQNIKLQRSLAVELLCHFDHHSCTKLAVTKLDVNITIPGEHKKFLSWWNNWTPCTGMMYADILIWNQMLDRYASTRNKEFLEYMACSENPEVILFYLDLLATDCSSANILLSMRDCGRIYRSIVKKHTDKDLVLDYILGNFRTLKPISVNEYLDVRDMIQNAYSLENVRKITDFIEEYYNQNHRDFRYLIPEAAARAREINEKIEFINRFEDKNK